MSSSRTAASARSLSKVLPVTRDGAWSSVTVCCASLVTAVVALATVVTAGAAEHWDYSAQGRAKNEDWDTFGRSQRNLIVKEMKWAEARARELEYWRTRFPRATKIMSVAEEGETAIVALEGGGATQLTLVKVGDDWYVSKLN